MCSKKCDINRTVSIVLLIWIMKFSDRQFHMDLLWNKLNRQEQDKSVDISLLNYLISLASYLLSPQDENPNTAEGCGSHYSCCM